MDLKVYIYLALAIGYYIFKFIRKQQEKQKQQTAASASKTPAYAPASEQNREVIQSPKKSTLDDLFKEFGMEETTESHERPEVYETHERAEIYKTYERAETNATDMELPSHKSYQSLQQTEKSTPIAGSEVSRLKNKKGPVQISEKLKSKTELKRAFIYTEIFKTKF